MAIVFGAAAGAVIWRAGHGNYSDDYSCHSQHSKYHEYGDSELRNEISNLESQVRNKENEVSNLQSRLQNNFNSKIAELKREKNYNGLNKSPNAIIDNVKADMKREIDSEIQRDKEELAEIDKIISKINEIELQSKQE